MNLMNDLLIAIACSMPSLIIAIIILEQMKSDYLVRFPGQVCSHTVRAYTHEEAKRAAKRLMRKLGHTSFRIRRR